jgi:effector-binding domain-containing protein
MAYDIELRQVDEQPVASTIIPGIQAHAVGAALHGALPDIFSHLEAKGVPMVGAPFARYHGGAGDTIDLEVGIPVAGDFPETDTIERRLLPGGDVITTTHVGTYDRLADAVGALAEWRVANGRVAGGPYWEVYVDDPSTVAPENVQTELFEPLAPEG